MWRHRERLERCTHKPRNRDCQQPLEASRKSWHCSLKCFQKEWAQLRRWFQTSAFLNCKKKIYFILRHPVCDNFLQKLSKKRIHSCSNMSFQQSPHTAGSALLLPPIQFSSGGSLCSQLISNIFLNVFATKTLYIFLTFSPNLTGLLT